MINYFAWYNSFPPLLNVSACLAASVITRHYYWDELWISDLNLISVSYVRPAAVQDRSSSLLNCQWDASVRILHHLWTPPTGRRLHSRTQGLKILPPHSWHLASRSLSRASWQAELLVVPLTGSVHRGKQTGHGNAVRTSAKGKHLHDETLRTRTTRWSKYAPLFSNRPPKTLALILSCILKTEWMTYIQLSDLLMPFQWLESLKNKATFPQTFSQMVVKHFGIDQPIRYCHTAAFLSSWRWINSANQLDKYGRKYKMTIKKILWENGNGGHWCS